eukprot:896975-Amphidinium_carterae.2
MTLLHIFSYFNQILKLYGCTGTKAIANLQYLPPITNAMIRSLQVNSGCAATGDAYHVGLYDVKLMHHALYQDEIHNEKQPLNP